MHTRNLLITCHLWTDAHTHIRTSGEEELAKSFESFVMLESRRVFLDQPLAAVHLYGARCWKCERLVFTRRTMFPRVHSGRSRTRSAPQRKVNVGWVITEMIFCICSGSCCDVTVRPPSLDSLQPSPPFSLYTWILFFFTLINTHKLVYIIYVNSFSWFKIH